MTDYDGPWKEALEKYFKAFIQFFFSKIHSEIDWSKGYEFLDKELEKIVRDAETGRRIADKLVKVYLSEGTETWLLIHIEIQSYAQSIFSQRMYVYNYRLFDRYQKETISLAVLTDDDPDYRPTKYVTGRWGCELIFKFPVIKICDYIKKWDLLEESPNPFSMVVMAHLKTQEFGKGREEERKLWKLRLTRMLYERGYDRQEILELFRFIDWLMILPEGLEDDFWKELQHIEENKNMPYITSVERIGIKKGLQQGIQQGLQQGKLEGTREILLETLNRRFGEIPDDIYQKIYEIKDFQTLKDMLIQIIICEDADHVRKIMM